MMSTPQDVRAVCQRFEQFVEKHKTQQRPEIDVSMEQGNLGCVGSAFRTLMALFARHLRIEPRKFLPDDFSGSNPLDTKTERMLKIVQELLEEEEG